MVKSTYTKTALASLIALYSFNGFATTEVKEHHTSSQMMKTSNKKLKEKMDRICNADPEKKAKEAKRKAEEEAMRANEAKKKAEEQAMKKAEESKKKAEKEAMKKAHDEKKKAEKEAMKAHEAKKKAEKEAKKKEESDDNKHKTKDIKSIVNKNIESKTTLINSGDADVCCTQRTGLKITFGGVVDAQGYGKTSSDNLKQYNTMPDKSKDYYTVIENQITGSNPLFTKGIGNIGDYSENMGVSADAMLHLRAENKNEDLGILYGADLQFDVPVTQGKVSSKNRGAHIFVNTEYGDVRLGYQFGPEAMMRLDATKIATVDGAADSGWFKKVNLEGSTASFPFYLTPRLYTESFSSESEKLSFRMAGKYNKAIINTLPFRVAYYSPSYMGARFGVSYSPRYESGLFSVSENNYQSALFNMYDEIASEFKKVGKLKISENVKDAAAVKAKLADSTGDNKVTVDNDGTFAANDKSKAVAALGNIFAEATLSESDKESLAEKYLTNITEIEAVFAKAKVAVPKADDLKSKIEAALGNDTKGRYNVDALCTAVNEVIKEYSAKNAQFWDNIIKAEITKQQNLNYRALSIAADTGTRPRHIGPDYEHIVSAGVSYEYDFEEYKLKVKASAVGEFGLAKKPNDDKHEYSEYVEYNNLMGVNLGFSADYKIDEDQTAKFAGSFAHLGKSGQPKVIHILEGNKYISLADKDKENARVKGLEQFQNNTMYWTVGAGYQYGNLYSSLTYFGSQMNDKDRLHDVALGVQYDLSAPGSKSKFVPYAAVHYFTTDEKNNPIKVDGKDTVNNKGVLLLTGVKFSF